LEQAFRKAFNQKIDEILFNIAIPIEVSFATLKTTAG